MYVFDSEKHHLPHIHVRYNEFKASIAIPDGEVLEGSLPVRQMKFVQAWIELHQDDLMADWFLASNGQTPFKIDPLLLLCQIIRKLVIPAGKRVSSAMDGELKSIHGAWIPAIPAGMTILDCGFMKSDKVELR